MAFSCISVSFFSLTANAVNPGIVGDVSTPYNDGLSPYVVYGTGPHANNPGSDGDDKESGNFVLYSAIDKSKDKGTYNYNDPNDKYYCLKIHNHTGRTAKITHIGEDSSTVLKQTQWVDTPPLYLEDHNHVSGGQAEGKEWYVEIKAKSLNVGIYDLTVTYNLEGVYNTNGTLVEFEQPFYIYVFDSNTKEFSDGSRFSTDEFKVNNEGLRLRISFSAKYGAFQTVKNGNFINAENQKDIAADVVGNTPFEYNYFVDPSVISQTDISDGTNIQWQDLGLRMDFYSTISNTNLIFQPYLQFARYGRGGMIKLDGDFSNREASFGGASFGIGNVDDDGSGGSLLVPGKYNGYSTGYWTDPCIATASSNRTGDYQVQDGLFNKPKHSSNPKSFEMRRLWGREWYNIDGVHADRGNLVENLNINEKHYFPFFGYMFKTNNPDNANIIQFGGFGDGAEQQNAPNPIDKGMVFESDQGGGNCAYNMQGKINVYICDKSKLRELLSAPNFSPLSARYNKSVWGQDDNNVNAYKGAIKAAVEALGNPYAKQSNVNTAATNLENAMKALGYDNGNYKDNLSTQFIKIEHHVHNGEYDAELKEPAFSIETSFDGSSKEATGDGEIPNYILVNLANEVHIDEFFYLNNKDEYKDSLCAGINKRTDLSDLTNISTADPISLETVQCHYWTIDYSSYEEQIRKEVDDARDLLADYWDYSDAHLDELLNKETGLLSKMLTAINAIPDKNNNTFSDHPKTGEEIQNVIDEFKAYLEHPETTAEFTNGFIVDFGLSSTYDVLDRGNHDYEKTIKEATSFSDYKIVGLFQSDEYDLSVDANKHPKSREEIGVELKNTITTEDECATISLNPDENNDAITYTPLKKVATDIETVYFVVESTRNGREDLGEDINDTVTTYTVSPIQIIPASVVYYEEDFGSINYVNGTANGEKDATKWEDVSGLNAGTEVQNWEHTGAYGFDPNYNNQETRRFSMNKAKKVTVSAENNPNSVYSGSEGNSWPYATFTFKGTGYELLTYMSRNTGAVEIALYEGTSIEDNNKLKSRRLIDTFSAYEYNDGNWSVASGDNALYQIPVVSETNLTYGQYTVKITPKYSTIFDHTNKGSYDFYIDGFRVYDPTGVATGADTKGKEVIKAKYASDGELIVDERSVRSMITKDGFNETGVFIQGKSNATYEDYIKYGPKNELYLTNGQSIAFTPKLTKLPDSFKIGETAVNIELSLHTVGTSPTATVRFANAENGLISEIRTYRNATPLYFKLPATLIQSNTNGNSNADGRFVQYQPITVTCTNGTVSLCNIKVTTDTDLNAPATANIVSPVSRIAMFRAMPMANTANNNKVKVSYGLTADELESVKAITERVAALSPDDGGHFVPDVFEVPETVTTDEDKAQIAVKTSSEVARVTVDGADASLAGEKDGVKEWIYVYTGDIGEHKLTVVAYNQSSYTSDAAEVKVIFNAPAVQPEPEKPSEPSTAPSDNDTENVTEQKSIFDKLIDFILSIFNLLKVLFNG